MKINIRFLPILAFFMTAFVGYCWAASGAGQRLESTDISSELEGRWSPDCDNLEGLKIDGSLKGIFTINSNQIIINSNLKEKYEKGNFIDVYLESTSDLGRGGMSLEWGNFSRFIPIAEIKINKPNEMELNWKGFFNKKNKSYQWKDRPDFYQKNETVNFYRCGN
jgi:hypothetical protein